jgi:signal peptidase II
MRLMFAISAIVVALDQLTKWLAVKHLLGHAAVAVAPFLNFVLVFNRGAAFGFLNNAGDWQNMFFVIVALIACGVIISLLSRLESRNTKVAVGLALILGGAIGNLIDRLVHGYVVDFIDVFYGSWHWPAFNIADSAISIGAVLLVLDAFGIGMRKRHTVS